MYASNRSRWPVTLIGLVATAMAAGQAAAAVIADSFDGWSATGTQGQNSWFNGYYNYTTDLDATYQTADFTAFLNDGSGIISPANHWDGTNWRLTSDPGGTGGPWTFLGQEQLHPNGTNSTPNEEHWTVRRWESTVDGQVTLETYLAAQNPGGTGTSAE